MARQRRNRLADDRVEVRLALARLFVQSGHRDDARDQVAFALAEARVGEANAVTAENLIDAGKVLASINQYELAEKYFQRAQAAGADEEMIDLGMANAELALGHTKNAQAFLKSFDSTARRKGDAHFNLGHVHDLTPEDPGMAYSAKVQDGKREEVYLHYDSVEGWSGECTCPIGDDCKHVAATLFAVIAEAPNRVAAVAAGPAAPELDAQLSYWVNQSIAALFRERRVRR